jgi:3-deoxy-manno-octulosonate cytidylyltransferase (CMP-KDO synthetase)
MDSKRFPGKPLEMAGGKALVQWTYEAAQEVSDLVYVATPDTEIGQFCNSHKMNCVMTASSWRNGTQRCAEAYSDILEMKSVLKEIPSRIVNWQVDEPLVCPGAVQVISNPSYFPTILTLACERISESDLLDESMAKVIVSSARQMRQCLWFSRAPMASAWGHIGVYSFCPLRLEMLARLEFTRYELDESLEQLCWLENDWPIHALECTTMPLSINTPEDMDEFREMVE